MNNLFFLIRPDIVFIFIWSICLFLAFNISFYDLDTLNLNSPVVIFISLISFQYLILFNVLKRFFKINKIPLLFSLRKRKFENSKRILKIANLLFYIWLIFLAIKIYIFGGVPILSRLFNDGSVNYTNFYLPTLGGCEQIIRILGNSFYVVYFLQPHVSHPPFFLLRVPPRFLCFLLCFLVVLFLAFFTCFLFFFL